jgi:hypothetical protein
VRSSHIADAQRWSARLFFPLDEVLVIRSACPVGIDGRTFEGLTNPTDLAIRKAAPQRGASVRLSSQTAAVYASGGPLQFPNMDLRRTKVVFSKFVLRSVDHPRGGVDRRRGMAHDHRPLETHTLRRAERGARFASWYLRQYFLRFAVATRRSDGR